MSSENFPRIGVGVIVIKNHQVLMGNRINSHGHNTWNFPGGHLEFNETPEECALREVKEETCLTIVNIRRAPWTNDFFKAENKHYITLYMIGDYQSGTPQVLEPNKCKSWGWYAWGQLPESLFLPIQNLLKLNFDPFKL